MVHEWSDDYKIGVAKIDEQHYELFKMVTGLFAINESNVDENLVKQTISYMVEYALKHFEDEESVQVEFMYPGFENHKQQHEDFKSTIRVMAGLFEQGFSFGLFDSLRRVLNLWLKSHVSNSDKKIGDHIAKLKKSAKKK